jgi:hypothetical protein
MATPKQEISKAVEAVRKMREAAKKAAQELEAERIREEEKKKPKSP